jgi:hypothetical protein
MFSVNTVKRLVDDCNRQFAICEYCYWCATFFIDSISEGDDWFKLCPMCNKRDSISLIPLQKNEAYRVSFEGKRGLDMQFLKLKQLSQ